MQGQQKISVVAVLLTVTLSSIAVSAQSVSSARNNVEIQRTPWGHPDLQGIWDRRTITPLERPERFADKAFLSLEEIRAYERESAARTDGRPLDYGRSGISVHDPGDLDYGTSVVAGGQTSLIVAPSDGRIPAYTEAYRERSAARAQAREGRGPADSWTDRSLTERCITWGIPGGMLPQAYNNNIQILQTPDTVMILNEMVHDIRIVPLDGRSHIAANIRQWHGDPRGHWQGDTLVVESTNFSAQSNFRGAAENLKLTERFTLTETGIQYEFTVEDPTTWVRPWSVSFPMVRSEEPVYEFACHEGNYGLKNILGIARNLEKQASEP